MSSELYMINRNLLEHSIYYNLQSKCYLLIHCSIIAHALFRNYFFLFYMFYLSFCIKCKLWIFMCALKEFQFKTVRIYYVKQNVEGGIC